MSLASYQKQIRMALLALILFGLFIATIFLGRQVSTFFARASQCPAANVGVQKVTASSAIISWDTEDETQGIVEYGTVSTNINVSVPEASAGKNHNLPLTLLTPNTVYYYLVSVGDAKCDSSGNRCTDNCVPWSFTTSAITPPASDVEPIVTQIDVPSASDTPLPPTLTLVPTTIPATPTSSLSLTCQQVKVNIGKNSSGDAANWNTLKQLDLDSNGIINSLDVIRCIKDQQ